MEDPNMLGADCVVISCCCQCLILQILIFVLLRLPCKLVKKTREYAKRKLQQRKKGKKVVMEREKSSLIYIEEIVRVHEQSFRIEGERAFLDIGEHSCGCCMEEVEKVMEEFSRRGKFGFGSFWGKEEPWGVPKIVTKHHQNDDDDDGFVRYVSEVIGALSCA